MQGAGSLAIIFSVMSLQMTGKMFHAMGCWACTEQQVVYGRLAAAHLTKITRSQRQPPVAAVLCKDKIF